MYERFDHFGTDETAEVVDCWWWWWRWVMGQAGMILIFWCYRASKRLLMEFSVFPFLILNKINVQIFCLWFCHVNFFFFFEQIHHYQIFFFEEKRGNYINPSLSLLVVLTRNLFVSMNGVK